MILRQLHDDVLVRLKILTITIHDLDNPHAGEEKEEEQNWIDELCEIRPKLKTLWYLQFDVHLAYTHTYLQALAKDLPLLRHLSAPCLFDGGLARLLLRS